jgi:sigma-E factor negative regulatory protein RseA
MSEDTKETARRELLSALVDGQIAPRQLRSGVDALLQDADLQRAWTRYWLISDVLKNTLSGEVGSDLFERVKRSVNAEPAVFGPRPRRWSTRRPAIGLALAASVAVVALLGLVTLGDRAGDKPYTAVANVETTALGERPKRMRWDIAQPAVEERLNSYLVNHSEYESGVRGMLSYARVVGYDGRE